MCMFIICVCNIYIYAYTHTNTNPDTYKRTQPNTARRVLLQDRVGGLPGAGVHGREAPHARGIVIDMYILCMDLCVIMYCTPHARVCVVVFLYLSVCMHASCADFPNQRTPTHPHQTHQQEQAAEEAEVAAAAEAGGERPRQRDRRLLPFKPSHLADLIQVSIYMMGCVWMDMRTDGRSQCHPTQTIRKRPTHRHIPISPHAVILMPSHTSKNNNNHYHKKQAMALLRAHPHVITQYPPTTPLYKIPRENGR